MCHAASPQKKCIFVFDKFKAQKIMKGLIYRRTQWVVNFVVSSCFILSFNNFLAEEKGFRINQGKGILILTNNSKGKFSHNTLRLFLPFLPMPLQLHEKKDMHPTYFQGFVLFVELIVRIARPVSCIITYSYSFA